MIQSLASVLLLGMLPSAFPTQVASPLPGGELLTVSAPSVSLASYKAPAVTASGVLLLDLTSGEQVYGKEEDAPRPMGSLTKMMTALLLIEQHDLSEIVTVPEGIAARGSAIGLTAGQRFRLHDLLKALLLPSANDVAYTLAIYHSGNVGAFVKEMNGRATALGLRDTHFADPAGFDSPEQYASPRDLAWLSAAVLRHPELEEIVRTPRATIRSLEGTSFELSNTNEMVHTSDNVYGMKTGTTDSAGQCLSTYFVTDERKYLLVLLHSSSRYRDTRLLMDALHPRLSLR